MKRILGFAFLTLWLVSCSQPDRHRQDKGKALLSDERIRIELEMMMEKEGPYTFVIFEEEETGKFVQFAGNKNEELLFDFPSAQLSKEEFERAGEVLEEYDIKHETSPTYTDETEAVENGSLSTFSKHLDDDIDLAVELTSVVMVEVLGFDKDVRLKVQTD